MAPRDTTPPETEPAFARTIKDLLSYRIHRVANALSRGAAVRYREGFDVSLMEWRTVALLGDFAPMTLKDLARQSSLDKGLASRVVSGLVDRGLVRRAISDGDGRELALRLTAAGRRLHRGLMAAARQRDRAFRDALSPAEAAVLEGALETLLRVARAQGGCGAAEAALPAARGLGGAGRGAKAAARPPVARHRMARSPV